MMNRRDAISRVALMLGTTISIPTLLACDRTTKESGHKVEMVDLKALANFQLSADQRKIVASIAEHIIPKTTTVGAIDVGVPAFIEMMIKDCYHAAEQNSFMDGMKNLENQAFLTKSAAEQIAILQKLEANTMAAMEARNVKKIKVGDNEDKEVMDAKPEPVPFWRLMKELTLLGYYTSEGGVNASFDYQPIPGKFEAIKLKKGQKSYAYLTA